MSFSAEKTGRNRVSSDSLVIGKASKLSFIDLPNRNILSEKGNLRVRFQRFFEPKENERSGVYLRGFIKP